MSLPQDGPSTAKDVGSDGSDSQAAQVDSSYRRKERRKSSKKNRMRFSAGKKRLSGGGDDAPGEPSEGVPAGADDAADTKTVRTTTMTVKSAVISAAPSKAAVSVVEEREPLRSTGDPRVDEMLECALTNLEEAGKALATLGENLEHEMKVDDEDESGIDSRVEQLAVKIGSARAHSLVHRGGSTLGRRSKKHD